MYILLVTTIIVLFLCMLFLNLYFRVKVLRAYRKLIEARIEFDPKLLFNKEKMNAEVLEKYPDHKNEIEIFQNHLRKSIRMATVLLILITAFGAVLMWYRFD